MCSDDSQLKYLDINNLEIVLNINMLFNKDTVYSRSYFEDQAQPILFEKSLIEELKLKEVRINSKYILKTSIFQDKELCFVSLNLC